MAMIDYFLEEIVNHSKDCGCSKCHPTSDEIHEVERVNQELERERADIRNAPSEPL